MTRRWVTLGLTLLAALALGGCLRTVELNPETLQPEDVDAATAHYGNVHFLDKRGIDYFAQSFEVSEDGGSFLLKMVEVVDDGVHTNEVDVALPRGSVVSIRYSENSPWILGSLVTGTALFMVYLYYKINTDVFD
ncbi:MAG: hypothetical protein JW819_01405 [Candidatus Krumholzibacteriota bacterium]|nr:hypothetical protein [Candidatus Krumholzibacteriota bacterium]